MGKVAATMPRLRCKVAVIGDATVGKTALVTMFRNASAYPKNYQMTVGAEFHQLEVNVPETDPPVVVELYLFDCAGQEMFKPMAAHHWTDTSMVILVYDVTSVSSFESLAGWVEQFKTVCPRVPGRPMTGCVVANKIDLGERIAVPRESGERFAQEHDLEFFDTSCAENIKVDIPFMYVASKFKELYDEKLAEFSTL